MTQRGSTLKNPKKIVQFFRTTSVGIAVYLHMTSL